MPADLVGLVAGEASGDLIGAHLLQAMQQRWPELQAAGIGGPRLVAQGLQAWWLAERLSVMGYSDALKRLPELLWIRRRLGTRLIQQRAKLFIGIDAPDFNLGLETRLRSAGLWTAHYVCPSIWAWRPERVTKIRAAADHVLCLFPFEPALLREAGIAASFVGHPLASLIPAQSDQAAARVALGLPEAGRVLALLPGSRASEIAFILPPLLAAARQLVAQNPGLRVLLPIAPGLRAQVEALTHGHAVQLFDGRAHEILAACDLTLVASGTATLEAALFKRPMVIAYRVGESNYRRMKKLQLQPWVGLPNVLAREFLVPECLQDECTAENLARAAQVWLDDPLAVERLQARFAELHDSLRADSAHLALEALAPFIERR
ncbi:MAG: lipid-A-disaccharide synthase [Burkholderiales bacterium]|nr:lipid-A-disaccharide synthase [Burkholderiales bacterium]